MYNIEAEMVRYGVSRADVARVIKKDYRTACNKLSGATDFTVPEAFAVRDELFPGMRVEYLFTEVG